MKLVRNIMLFFFLFQGFQCLYAQNDTNHVGINMQPWCLDSMWLGDCILSKNTKTLMINGSCGQLLSDLDGHWYKNTTCLSWHDTTTINCINNYIKEHSEIENLIIENPRHIINSIDFRGFQNLKNVRFNGNDSDSLDTLPDNLLHLPKLKVVTFYAIRIHSKDVLEIKRRFPKLKVKYEKYDDYELLDKEN